MHSTSMEFLAGITMAEVTSLWLVDVDVESHIVAVAASGELGLLRFAFFLGSIRGLGFPVVAVLALLLLGAGALVGLIFAGHFACGVLDVRGDGSLEASGGESGQRSREGCWLLECVGLDRAATESGIDGLGCDSS